MRTKYILCLIVLLAGVGGVTYGSQWWDIVFADLGERFFLQPELDELTVAIVDMKEKNKGWAKARISLWKEKFRIPQDESADDLWSKWQSNLDQTIESHRDKIEKSVKTISKEIHPRSYRKQFNLTMFDWLKNNLKRK